MRSNREFLALFIIFVLVFSLLSIFTEQRLQAFDLQRFVPRFYAVAPQGEPTSGTAGDNAIDAGTDTADEGAPPAGD